MANRGKKATILEMPITEVKNIILVFLKVMRGSYNIDIHRRLQSSKFVKILDVKIMEIYVTNIFGLIMEKELIQSNLETN